jgi:CRP/FNR family transcriptional regulator, nitrogen fixation regulation protein
MSANIHPAHICDDKVLSRHERWRDAQLAHPTATIASCEADHEVIGEGDPAANYYKVVEGVFRAVKFTPDGRRQIFAFYYAGDMFGLETNPYHAATVEAVTDGLVAMFSRESMRQALPANPALAAELFKGAAQALCDATEHMMMIGRSTAEERVAWFLCKAARHANAGDRRMATCLLAMSRRDMADYLGLTIETISRALGTFKQRGIIALRTARDVEIRRPDWLARIAAADRDNPIIVSRAAA